MQLTRKISAILLLLYYVAHIYSVHIHVAPEKVKDLNHAVTYSSDSGISNQLHELKSHCRHLPVHNTIKFNKQNKSQALPNTIATEERLAWLTILHVSITTHSFYIVTDSHVNKAPPAINS